MDGTIDGFSHGLVNIRATIARSYKIAMGHRLPNHKGKCRNYHGHTWTIWIYLLRKDAPLVDDADASDHAMVSDFGDADAIIKPVLAEYDHSMLLRSDDPLIPALFKEGSKLALISLSPTSEAFGAVLLGRLEPLLDVAGLYCARVLVSESENSVAVIDNARPLS